MNVAGKPCRTIWPTAVRIIDQTLLPHRFATVRLATAAEVARAIRTMQVRGAPLIGAAGAWGLALALRADPSDAALTAAHAALLATRPTAVNLRWALDRIHNLVTVLPPSARAAAAGAAAAAIAEEGVAANAALATLGFALFEQRRRALPAGARLDILTHCNAGWLATVDGGTALAPVYRAHDRGLPVHVWVDETRPRNQGASLTAWELGQHGVPHTVIADNAGGHLLRTGRIALVIVGADRIAANGDVANKIGTYLKALAARDCGVPFYVAAPGSTIDWSCPDGDAIPVEERDAREVTHVTGAAADGGLVEVRLTPAGSPAANPAFDITPARLVTALITEKGVCPASRSGLEGLYPPSTPAPVSANP